MRAFVVPSIFTAVNQYSGPVSAMIASTNSFNGHAGRLNNTLSEAVKQITAFGSAAAVAGAAVAGVIFSGKSLMDYEKELANLKALTGVSGSEFMKFKGQIHSVALETKESSVEVAKGFTTIANAMPELLSDSVGLGAVTKASIILAQASRMELAPAAEATTTILNAFGLGAAQAAGLVDKLAAGSKYGSAEITDLAASIKEFGAQAKLSGVTLSESIGLTELVSKFRKGAEAGTELRNVLLYMSTIKVQDPKALGDLARLGVNMDKVSSSTLPLSVRLNELKKIANDSAAMFHLFGKENMSMASAVLQNVDKLPGLISNIEESGNASRMAGENTNTLSKAVEQLGNKWVTIITSSSGANLGLDAVRGTVQFLSNNLEDLLGLVALGIGAFSAWKAGTLLLSAGLKAVAFWEGIVTVRNGVYATSCFASIAGMNGMAVASFFLEGSLLSLAVASGGVLVVLGLLVAAFGEGYDSSRDYTKALEDQKRGFEKLKTPIDQAHIALEKYNEAMRDYNDLQNFKAKQQYADNKGAVYGFLSRVIDAFAHPIQTGQAATENSSMNKSLLLPQKDAFFQNPSDTSLITNPIVDSAKANYNKTETTTNNKVSIEVKAADGSSAQVTGNTGGIPIEMTATVGTWTKSGTKYS